MDYKAYYANCGSEREYPYDIPTLEVLESDSEYMMSVFKEVVHKVVFNVCDDTDYSDRLRDPRFMATKFFGFTESIRGVAFIKYYKKVKKEDRWFMDFVKDFVTVYKPKISKDENGETIHVIDSDPVKILTHLKAYKRDIELKTLLNE
jgi:hypothetical protein